jgi:AmmeMemoRadiSam system protein B/AmmeMemoRadiSam system protein A
MSKEPIMTATRRSPSAAGLFYPSDPDKLRAMVQSFLEVPTGSPRSYPVQAIVAPHAGYEYSGQVAGAAWRAVAGRSIEVVLVLAPSHQDRFDGLSVYPGDSYETPLGSVPIDESTRDRLVQAGEELVQAGVPGHGAEHAIEVQLPFLQVLLPNSRLVPVSVGRLDSDGCRRLGQIIAPLLTSGRTLLVASSDLYHGPSAADCRETDRLTLDALEAADPVRFFQGAASGEFQACGAGPIAIALHATQDERFSQVKILMHRTSAEITGPQSDYVVGYGAAGLRTHGWVPLRTGEFSRQDLLLEAARQAIADHLEGRESSASSRPPEGEGGVFVTLWNDDGLRGCVGVTERKEDLVSTVRHCARSAAFRDPRFEPVTADELEGLAIEISLLTPLTPLDDPSPDRVRVGTDGLQITCQGHTGLLLPHVPVQADWDAERFLQETCRKAMLPPDAWQRSDAMVSVFQARKLSET